MSSFDLQRVLESKRAFRQNLAARPLAEKLRMLDELHARALTIRSASHARDASATPGAVHENPQDYRSPPRC